MKIKLTQAVQPAINKKFGNLLKKMTYLLHKKSGNVQFSTQDQVRSKKRSSFLRMSNFSRKIKSNEQKRSFFHAKASEEQTKDHHARKKIKNEEAPKNKKESGQPAYLTESEKSPGELSLSRIRNAPSG